MLAEPLQKDNLLEITYYLDGGRIKPISEVE
jgi:hypothetical protein